MTTPAREPARERRHPTNRVQALRSALVGTLHGTVLELGPGRGANLPHYPDRVRWIGLEPSTRHLDRIRREALRLGRPARILAAQAERIALADHGVDAVVATYVLCSVEDPVAVLAEIRRVLRPEGRYVFAEHVAAPAGSWVRRCQDTWVSTTAVFGRRRSACRPNREIGSTIEQAGFDTVDLHRFAPPQPGARVRLLEGREDHTRRAIDAAWSESTDGLQTAQGGG